MRTLRTLTGFALASMLAITLLTAARATSTVSAVPPPTGLAVTWAGYNVSGQVVGVLLTWNVDSSATSYNVYRGTAVVGQQIGTSTLIASGVTLTQYYDPGITMGIDTVTYYQISAVNSLGESAKTTPVVAAQFPAIPSTIQGVIIPTPGPIPGYITVQVNPFSCAPGVVCPQFIAAPETFLVDIRGVIYEASDGAPTMPFPLLGGDEVVVTGSRVPGSGTPSITATTIENGVPEP